MLWQWATPPPSKGAKKGAQQWLGVHDTVGTLGTVGTVGMQSQRTSGGARFVGLSLHQSVPAVALCPRHWLHPPLAKGPRKGPSIGSVSKTLWALWAQWAQWECRAKEPLGGARFVGLRSVICSTHTVSSESPIPRFSRYQKWGHP